MFQKKISELRDSNKFEKLQICFWRIFIIRPLVYSILELLCQSTSYVVSSEFGDTCRPDLHDLKHANLRVSRHHDVQGSQPVAVRLHSPRDVHLPDPRCYRWKVSTTYRIILTIRITIRPWLWCYKCCNGGLCCNANYEDGWLATFLCFCYCYS